MRPDLFAVEIEPLDFALPDGRPIASFRSRFLNVSAWDSRKNLPSLLEAWYRSTTPEDDAVLLLKLSAATPGVTRFIAN